MRFIALAVLVLIHALPVSLQAEQNTKTKQEKKEKSYISYVVGLVAAAGAAVAVYCGLRGRGDDEDGGGKTHAFISRTDHKKNDDTTDKRQGQLGLGDVVDAVMNSAGHHSNPSAQGRKIINRYSSPSLSESSVQSSQPTLRRIRSAPLLDAQNSGNSPALPLIVPRTKSESRLSSPLSLVVDNQDTSDKAEESKAMLDAPEVLASPFQSGSVSFLPSSILDISHQEEDHQEVTSDQSEKPAQERMPGSQSPELQTAVAVSIQGRVSQGLVSPASSRRSSLSLSDNLSPESKNNRRSSSPDPLDIQQAQQESTSPLPGLSVIMQRRPASPPSQRLSSAVPSQASSLLLGNLPQESRSKSGLLSLFHESSEQKELSEDERCKQLEQKMSTLQSEINVTRAHVDEEKIEEMYKKQAQGLAPEAFNLACTALNPANKLFAQTYYLHLKREFPIVYEAGLGINHKEEAYVCQIRRLKHPFQKDTLEMQPFCGSISQGPTGLKLDFQGEEIEKEDGYYYTDYWITDSEYIREIWLQRPENREKAQKDHKAFYIGFSVGQKRENGLLGSIEALIMGSL